MLGRLLGVSYIVLIHGMMICALASVRLSRKLPNRAWCSSLQLGARIATRGFCTAHSTESTEVSKHYRVEPDELLDVLKKFGTDIRAKPDGQFELKECKLCTKRNRDKPDNLWKLHVWPSGSYNCFRCSSSGNWYDLKEKASGPGCDPSTSEKINVFQVGGKAATSGNDKSLASKDKAPYVIPNQSISSKVYYNLFPNASRKPAKETEAEVARRTQVKEYLNNVRGLNDEVLKKYNIGYTVQQYLSNENEWVDHVCMTFPWQVGPDVLEGKELKYTSPEEGNILRESTIVRIKYRALATKGLQRILPKGGMWAFFGWHTVPAPLGDSAADPTATPLPSESIVITEGEYDCMAVSQALYQLPESDPLRHVPAVSLPNGCNSMPTELIPLLERFDKIYLWLDNDKSGQEAADKLVQKLGARRCVVVRPLEDALNPPKDANDALRQDPQLIPAMLRAAQGVTQDSTIGFSEGRDSVLQSVLRRLATEGSLTPSLPGLTDLCKGFRRGELVILTGPTGSGKTTLLSQLSLDFAQQGRPVLWGSFEVKNTRLMGKMLQQYHKSAPLGSLSADKVQAVANDFEALPIRFLNFHGSTHIDKLMDAMDQAVYRDDVQHVIIDNLQFMMPDNLPNKTGFEKFDYMDAVVHRLRKFATEKDVNIVLVIHPRKEEEDARLTMSSIFGTAKATQEADLVLILQRYAGKSFLEVKKNRYDGVTGRVDLAFNPVSICYEDASLTASCTTSSSATSSTSRAKAAPAVSPPPPPSPSPSVLRPYSSGSTTKFFDPAVVGVFLDETRVGGGFYTLDNGVAAEDQQVPVPVSSGDAEAASPEPIKPAKYATSAPAVAVSTSAPAPAPAPAKPDYSGSSSGSAGSSANAKKVYNPRTPAASAPVKAYNSNAGSAATTPASPPTQSASPGGGASSGSSNSSGYKYKSARKPASTTAAGASPASSVATSPAPTAPVVPVAPAAASVAEAVAVAVVPAGYRYKKTSKPKVDSVKKSTN